MTRRLLGATSAAALCMLAASAAGAAELDSDNLYAFGHGLTDAGNRFASDGRSRGILRIEADPPLSVFLHGPNDEGTRDGATTRLGVDYRLSDTVVPGVAFGPFAGLTYRRGTIDGYQEDRGGPLNLDVERQTDESLVGSLGIRASAATDSPLGRFISRLSLSIERELSRDDAVMTTSLRGNGRSRMEADGSDVEAIRVDGALGIRFTEALSTGIDYAGRVGTERGAEYEVLARFIIGF